MLTQHPVVVTVCALTGMTLYGVLCGARRLLKSLKLSLSLFALVALLNPIFSHKGSTVVLFLNDNPITLEACLYGLAASGMIVATLYWFRSFSRIMTGDRLLYLLGGLSPGLALVISMALRYVPLYGRQWRRVEETQRTLGLYREENAVDTLRGKARVFSAMTTWALENGVITADSMAARGYGTGRRTHFTLFRFRPDDILLLVLSLVLAGVSLWGAAGRTVQYYPVFSLSPLTGRALAGYLAYGGLALLPLMLQIKEWIAWRFWNWRT
jgi:energy-coupling factor transport system permease protein